MCKIISNSCTGLIRNTILNFQNKWNTKHSCFCKIENNYPFKTKEKDFDKYNVLISY